MTLFTACKSEPAPEEAPKPTTTTAAVEKPAEPAEAAVALAPNSTFTGDPAAGEEIFKATCIACHGADGKGNGGMTSVDFSKDNRFSKPEADLMVSIAEGIMGKTPAMPPNKDLYNEEQRLNALAYMAKTFGQNATP